MKYVLAADDEPINRDIIEEILEDEFEVAIIALHRDGEFMLHPHDDFTLFAGDRFVASASLQALNDLSDLTPPLREYDRYLEGRWPIKTSKAAD